MKKVILIGGTMGVGKTATGQTLKKQLPRSVFLDGDWCWDMNPFTVTEETKQMVLSNIIFLLNNFIACSEIDNIILSWVMSEQETVDTIASALPKNECCIYPISLICSKDVLDKRLKSDISQGLRNPTIIERSFDRLNCYDKLATFKIDVSEMTPENAAEAIKGLSGCRKQ